MNVIFIEKTKEGENVAEITAIGDKALPNIKHNEKIWIAEAKSRYDKKWKNKQVHRETF